MINYKIVPLTTESEMDEKGYVHWKSWHETYEGLIPGDYLNGITLEKCVKMAQKWTENVLLLKIDGKVVGFSCIGKSKDENNTEELIAIYLLKEYRGKKLGFELLSKTISQLSPNMRIVLWVLKDNNRAIKFYERFGFTFTGKEKSLPFGTELQMEIKK